MCRVRTWYRPGRSERVARFAHPRPTEDGEQLKYRKNEARCVLITSGLGPRLHMFAHLRPCDAKEASGLLTVAAAAVRKHIEHVVILKPSYTRRSLYGPETYWFPWLMQWIADRLANFAKPLVPIHSDCGISGRVYSFLVHKTKVLV